MSSTEPPSLLQRIRDGDIQAFERLFREYHAPLCEFVDRFVQSQAIAEEIVQDLFLVLWMNRQTTAVTSLRGYLFTAARNRALHFLRHQTFRARLGRRHGSRPELAGVAEAGEPVDQTVEREEQRADIERAIGRLPRRSRLAFEFSWKQQLTQVEIASRMGISVKGVEKLLATAKRLLRELLERHAEPRPAPPD